MSKYIVGGEGKRKTLKRRKNIANSFYMHPRGGLGRGAARGQSPLVAQKMIILVFLINFSRQIPSNSDGFVNLNGY